MRRTSFRLCFMAILIILAPAILLLYPLPSYELSTSTVSALPNPTWIYAKTTTATTSSSVTTVTASSSAKTTLQGSGGAGGGSGGGGGPSPYMPEPEAIPVSSRIVSVSQAFLGYLTQGSFETVVTDFDTLTSGVSGYYDQKILRLKADFWIGELIVRLPNENLTIFSFEAKRIIATYGKVISAEVVIKDITDAYRPGAKAPLATIKIVLEEKPGEQVQQLAPIQLFFYNTFNTLASVLSYLLYALIVAVPVAFVLFGLVIIVVKIAWQIVRTIKPNRAR